MARAAILLLICAVSVRTDLRDGRIPNRWTGLGVFAGVLLGVASGGPGGGLTAIAGALVVALVPLMLFYRRAMGGGDVKLFGAVGALIGAESGMEVELMSFVLGAVAGVWIWVRDGAIRRQLILAKNLLNPFSPDPVAEAALTRIRFAPFMFAAAVLAVLRSMPA